MENNDQPTEKELQTDLTYEAWKKRAYMTPEVRKAGAMKMLDQLEGQDLISSIHRIRMAYGFTRREMSAIVTEWRNA